MHWKKWAINTSVYPEVQKKVEGVLRTLIETFFFRAGDYVQEKFVRAFVEPIVYLEKCLQYQREIHCSQQCARILSRTEMPGVIQKNEEVQRILSAEISRQTRHYMLFLSSITKEGDVA